MSAVRVRILVAVDDKGNWAAYGVGDQEECADHTYCQARGEFPTGCRYHWIEADVPLPEAESMIEGDVTDDGP